MKVFTLSCLAILLGCFPGLKSMEVLAQQTESSSPVLAQKNRGKEGKDSNPFVLKPGTGEFEIHCFGRPIASYIYHHQELTRPAIVNLRTISGVQLTREFPAPEQADHRWMHPGIAISFGWVDGHDFWRGKAKVKHVRFVQEPTLTSGAITWTALNRYMSEDGKLVVCHEEARYELKYRTNGFQLDIDSSFYNEDRAFSFGDQEESGLCVRVTPALSVKQGSGRIINDRGQTNEAGTWGKNFDWIEYSGLSPKNKRVGIRIHPHPENVRACWSHSRDYGLLVANPFPKQPQSRREPFNKTEVQKGERYRFRVSLLVFEKDP